MSKKPPKYKSERHDLHHDQEYLEERMNAILKKDPELPLKMVAERLGISHRLLYHIRSIRRANAEKFTDVH
jgi:hypothetical protein